MRIKHFYYCVLYLFHIRVLGKLLSMEASQQSRSMRSRSNLLNKDRIDAQLTSESHHDDSEQVHYSKEKCNESSTGNSKHKNLTCNYCHKKGHIRFECCLQKKKQLDANVTELVEGDEEQCDVLLVTDQLITKIDGS